MKNDGNMKLSYLELSNQKLTKPFQSIQTRYMWLFSAQTTQSITDNMHETTQQRRCIIHKFIITVYFTGAHKQASLPPHVDGRR